MKQLLFMLSWGCCALLTAQDVSDSTDMFFRHLELNEVTVIGVAGETLLKNSSAPIMRVTNQQLRQTASSNLIDAIALQPGVAQVTTGAGISKPIIRGLGYNRVLVVNDGVRQEGQQWGDEHGIEVDVNAVGSVEILKGPASLMYGSDAMAGVLLLRSAPVLPEGTMQANVRSEVQSNNGLFGYSANFGGHEGSFVWDLRWSQRLAHAYKNKYDGYVPGSQFREQGASALLGLNQRWGYTHLTFSHFHLTPGIIEGERNPLTGNLLHDAPLKTYGRPLPFQQVLHDKAVCENKFYIGEGSLQATLAYQQNRRKEFEDSSADPGLHFQLHTTTYDIRYVSGETDGWRLTGGTGGMWQRSLNKGDEYLIPAYSLVDFGLFAMTQKELGRWSLSGGLRWDHRHLHSESLTLGSDIRFADFSRSFSAFSGSVGAVLHVGERVNIRMNLAHGFRAPNMSELGSNGEHEGTLRYEVGNSRLKAEHSWQFDLGMDFSSRYVSGTLALFAERIDHFVFAHRTSEVFDPDLLTYRYTQGDARLLGFELQVDLHPIHSLHWENTFSYVDARQLHQQSTDTRYLPLTPAPRWTSDVKYELTHRQRTFNNAYISIGVEACMRQSHIYRADATETVTPAYMLINCAAGTDLLLGGKKVCELSLCVQNLLDHAYQSHLSRLKYADVNAVSGRRGVFNMGRNIVLKLMFPFTFEH